MTKHCWVVGDLRLDHYGAMTWRRFPYYQYVITVMPYCYHWSFVKEIHRYGSYKASDAHLSWWRHQMETFSALLALCAGNSPAAGEFPSQRPVTRSFDVSLICALNKRLSKQSWGWWFETPSCSLWCHRNWCFVVWAEQAIGQIVIAGVFWRHGTHVTSL